MHGSRKMHISKQKFELSCFILPPHFFTIMSTPALFDYATIYACMVVAQAFLEMSSKILALGWTLVATNSQAEVT